MLKIASENGVMVGDWKYLKLYEEYLNMRKNRLKYKYVIHELAVEHGISRSKVERIIRKFGKEC